MYRYEFDFDRDLARLVTPVFLRARRTLPEDQRAQTDRGLGQSRESGSGELSVRPVLV